MVGNVYNCIIIDNGTIKCKVCFSGKNNPKYSFPFFRGNKKSYAML